MTIHRIKDTWGNWLGRPILVGVVVFLMSSPTVLGVVFAKGLALEWLFLPLGLTPAACVLTLIYSDDSKWARNTRLKLTAIALGFLPWFITSKLLHWGAFPSFLIFWGVMLLAHVLLQFLFPKYF
jgi:hypothetical protein